jgi:phage tail-like protein
MSDRYGSFRYLVEIDGVTRAAFGYCAGLDGGPRHVDFYISDDEIDLRTVADPEVEGHIVLAQGFAFDDTLPAWENTCEQGRPERHDGTIVEIDALGHVRGRWQFRGAWPVTYEVAGSVGEGGRTTINTIELAYDELSPA